MSIKIIISLDVSDFDQFKSVFETAREYREEAGISESEAYRNIGSPNNVWIIATAVSKEAFFEFFSSDAQKERMKQASVSGSPTITLLES